MLVYGLKHSISNAHHIEHSHACIIRAILSVQLKQTSFFAMLALSILTFLFLSEADATRVDGRLPAGHTDGGLAPCHNRPYHEVPVLHCDVHGHW